MPNSVDRTRLRDLTARELARFEQDHPRSRELSERAKANLLAASISEAMDCTAFGPMVAVPVLFVHSFLQTKTIELITSLETAAGKYMTLVADRQSAKAQTRLELVKAANG